MDPVSLTAISLGASAIGGGTSAIGSITGGQSQAAMYKYQAGVALMNQQIAKQNADYAIESGEIQAQTEDLKTRAQIGTTIAQQGAGNLAVGSGSNAAVVQSEREIGAENTAIIRSNAAKTAYGFEVQAVQAGSQATLDQMAASKSKTAGYLSGLGSLISSAGSVSSKWLGAKSAGVFGEGTSLNEEFA